MLKNIFLLILVVGLIGCSKTTNSIPVSQAIPSDSLFAIIEIGMEKKQIFDLIGPPSDLQSTHSGKLWIPFYNGGDIALTVYYYKGEGRLIFSSGNNRVMKIDYDPSEDGHK